MYSYGDYNHFYIPAKIASIPREGDYLRIQWPPEGFYNIHFYFKERYADTEYVENVNVAPNYRSFLRRFLAFRMAPIPVTMEQLHKEHVQLLNKFEEVQIKLEMLSVQLDAIMKYRP